MSNAVTAPIDPVTQADAEVLLAQPRGFCAGVDRAIEIVERALELFGAPIYVRHEIVHNAYVVSDLRNKGAVFVQELDDVPVGGTVIFSAHGVSRAVREAAEARGLRVFDATCPLVTKVHVEVSKMRAQGFEIIMIGHKGHPEVEGTMGQANDGMLLVESVDDVTHLVVKDPTRLAYVTQTTLSVDETQEIVAAIKARFPAVHEPKKQDICYATQNRQDAVKFMAPQVEVVIVVGSPNSSNSNRLRELAEKLGVPAYMVDTPEQVKPEWLAGKRRVGLTAGASAPEELAQSIVDRLKALGARTVRPLDGIQENMSFLYRGDFKPIERLYVNAHLTVGKKCTKTVRPNAVHKALFDSQRPLKPEWPFHFVHCKNGFNAREALIYRAYLPPSRMAPGFSLVWHASCYDLSPIANACAK